MVTLSNFFDSLRTTVAGDATTFLQIGAPGPDILRDVAKIMQECTTLHFQESTQRSEEVLQYGCASGDLFVKTELAKFLSEIYRNPVHSDDLFINSGASQGLANILVHYFKEGDTLFVGDPTYSMLLQAASTLFRLNVIAVEVDDSGLKVDELEKYLPNLTSEPLSERYPYRAAVYTIPAYHNPTGVCMSSERCQKLVKLARQYDLLVIADDIYNILTYFSGNDEYPSLVKPPTRLIQYDEKTDQDYKGNVVSISSFSKIIAPGLRLGWYEMPQHMMKTFETIYVTDSGGGWSPYTSALVAAGLKSGIIQKHVKQLRDTYGQKMKGVHDILMTELARYGVTCRCPQGGIFVWISLPEKCSAQTVLAACTGKVSFVTGDECSSSGRFGNCLRISIAFYEADVLYAAVRQICDAVKSILADNAQY